MGRSICRYARIGHEERDGAGLDGGGHVAEALGSGQLVGGDAVHGERYDRGDDVLMNRLKEVGRLKFGREGQGVTQEHAD